MADYSSQQPADHLDLRHSELYAEANESVARFVAYAGTYLLWGVIGVIGVALLVVA